MTTFETLVLIFYSLFAFGYMVNFFVIKEIDSSWLRAVIVFLSLTLGMIWFPMVLGMDIFNKLKDYGSGFKESNGRIK